MERFVAQTSATFSATNLMNQLTTLRHRLASTFDRKTLRADLLAGLTASIPSIPDAMASGVLAGVSPVYGLYGLTTGTPIAALFTGSAFMSVVTTSAMSIAIGSALLGYPADKLPSALLTLALVIGLVQVVAGLLKLGSLMRFVSNSVMTGFLTGVAILIILGQLPDLTGYQSPYSNKVLQAGDLLLHWNQVDWATLLVGLVALGLIIGLSLHWSDGMPPSYGGASNSQP
jgi:SulP family sulfate permease